MIEAFSRTDRRWQSLRASGREWRDTERANRAFEQHFATVTSGAGSFRASHVTDELAPQASEDRWDLWIDHDGSKREEFSDGRDRITVITVGDTWWSWSRSLGPQTNGGRHNHSHATCPSEGLLDPARAWTYLDLEVLSSKDQLLEHTVLTVRGLPLAFSDPPHHVAATAFFNLLGLGADEYILDLDVGHRLLLRSEARIGGESFRVVETTEVSFDQGIDPTTFTVTW